MDYKERDIYQRSVKFAVAAIKMIDGLPNKISFREIARQLIRSSTSISANIAEGSAGVSKKEFINFIAIAKKSAVESEHWLGLLKQLGIDAESLLKDCVELIKILTSIINSTKSK